MMTEERDGRDLVPVEEAALELGTTPLSVLMRIKRGVLEGRELEGRWYVVQGSLERLQAEGTQENGEPLCRSHCSSKGGCSSCH